MIITTRNGKEILVNDDFEIPSGWSINVTSHGYARLLRATGKRFPSGAYKYDSVYLHRHIMKPPKNMQVDHINGNKLDNRRANLRICNNADNNYNKGQRKGKYKGVHYSNNSNKWVAQITKNGKTKHLGLFVDQDDAALAYNEAARSLHGEFAYVNKIG